MALIQSIDYLTKRIYLSIDSVGITLDTMDIYREVRTLRAINENDRKFDPMIVAGGNIQKTASKFTQPYVQLLYGCEIIPYDSDQVLTLVRDTFSDDGREQAQCFNLTGLSSTVVIVEAVEKVEVREVTVGGSTLTKEEIRQEMDANSSKMELIRLLAQELHRIQGLDVLTPMVVTPTTRTAGPITLDISGDGETITTVTRQ